MRVNCRYNSEDSLEDNQSTTSSTESRQSDFQRKASVSFILKTWRLLPAWSQLLFIFFMIILQDQEFIPTRTSGIMASKPAANPGQFTRINSNPLLISAQKQLLQVEEARKKKKEQERKQIIGDDTPDWQSVSGKNFVTQNLPRVFKYHHFWLCNTFRILTDGSRGGGSKVRTRLKDLRKSRGLATMTGRMGTENRESQSQ